MKRKNELLMAALLSALMLCGCVSEESRQQKRKKIEYHNNVQKTATNYPYDIYEVRYKGHDYIVFGGNEGQGYGMGSGRHSGVVHSPDCRKCGH